MKSDEAFITAETLEIPENIPLQWELFRGFGWSELLKSGVIVAIAALLAYVYTLLSSSPFRILTAIFILFAAGIIAVGLFVQQSNRLSIYDYIKYAVQFGRTQKQYDDIRIEEVITYDEEDV